VSATKLKPCPFCGSDQQLVVTKTATNEWFFGCDFCGARGPVRFGREVAREHWNHRAKEPKR